MSKTVPISNIMYDNKYVEKVSIKDIVAFWYDTIYTTKLRKINYQQSVLSNDAHITEGKLKIYDHVDPIIAFAKKSKNVNEFIDHLVDKYKLTPIQAKAITEMKIHQLNNTSKDELQRIIDEAHKKIAELDEKSRHIDDAIIDDLEKLRKKYGRPRRTIVLEEHEVNNKNISSIPMSNGAILWSRNQYAIFDLNNLINGKTLMNGVKNVKFEGKNVKEIIGCHNVKDDLVGILLFMKNGTAKRINVSDIVGINNWISVADEPVISGIIPIHDDNDKYIVISDNNKIKISSVESFGKQAVTTGNIRLVQRVEKGKDVCLITTESGRYHFIKISDIPELGRTASGVNITLPDNESISMIQMEQYSDETGLCSIVDDSGYSYVLRIEQDLLEETNRVNKVKKLIELDDGFKMTNVNLVNTKEKDCKCILIGRNSTSQISMQNIRSSDMTRIPKRVPVNTLGIVSYKI